MRQAAAHLNPAARPRPKNDVDVDADAEGGTASTLLPSQYNPQLPARTPHTEHSRFCHPPHTDTLIIPYTRSTHRKHRWHISITESCIDCVTRLGGSLLQPLVCSECKHSPPQSRQQTVCPAVTSLPRLASSSHQSYHIFVSGVPARHPVGQAGLHNGSLPRSDLSIQ